MLHKCAYAEAIGAVADWITDPETDKRVCKFCHAPEETQKAAPKKAPTVKEK
jgi:hypothetical protein